MDERHFQTFIDKLQDFDYESVLKKIRSGVKKPGILLCGATGAGKSSLINHLFGMEVADSGSGKNVTDRISRYEPEKYPVVLYDTAGYEMGEKRQEKFYKDVIGFVKKSNGSGDVKKQIHQVWYCISAATKRITPMDLAAIGALSGQAEVCVVLTQIDAATVSELNEMKKTLAERLPDTDVFRVSLDPRVPERDMDWDEMLQWSVDHLDSGLKLAMAEALGQELLVKRMEADKLISRYLVAAGGAVAMPLPMTDSAALIAIQTAMATHLFNYWGIDRGTDKIKEIFVNVVVANAGRIMSRTLLKLIPGVGSVATVLINGSVATTFTWAFGKAINEICYKAARLLAKGQKVDFTAAFAMDTVLRLVQKYYQRKQKG